MNSNNTVELVWYEVTCVNGHKYYTKAKNSTDAKTIICKRRGHRPSDYWTGITTYKAKKITEAEVPDYYK